MKRVTVFSGHYGSGKTNIAVNYALDLGSMGHKVSIADLDIVNPYFRTKDSEELFRQNGVELISLPFANTSVDLPSLPSAAYGLFERRDRKVVIDLGGDDRGALALGRFVPYIREENDYEMIFVVNFYRPLTTTVEDAYEVFKEIEYASKIKFTKIVNNSNLGAETTAEDVLKTDALAKKLAEMTDTEILFTSVEDSLLEGVSKVLGRDKTFSMKLQEKLF